jgi:hypothetical protein
VTHALAAVSGWGLSLGPIHRLEMYVYSLLRDDLG